jgi:Ni,Fe-hydrogenase III large subunit
MEAALVTAQFPEHWIKQVEVLPEGGHYRCEVHCRPSRYRQLCKWVQAMGFVFAGLLVEQGPVDWQLRYVFCPSDEDSKPAESCWIHLLLSQPLSQTSFVSVIDILPAADWHEREAEDLFGLKFEGHPRLGDFVLHDDAWQEGVAPMRKEFDAQRPLLHRAPDPSWRPRRIVHAPGAFAMPIGPVFTGVAESAHFILETVGEDVIRALPRFYYKHRAVEKIAEGRSPADVLLLAERFNGIAAFSHGLAFAQALESIGEIEVPTRAQTLRVLLAELERLRYHTGLIHDICESTALMVAASQAGMFEEELLRLCGALVGHRYLFGLIACGGLTRDFDDSELAASVERARAILHRLTRLEVNLIKTSSFLDRLEEVGIVTEAEARDYGLVGPIARASGITRDLRRLQPYSSYDQYLFAVPREIEGDGYARLRVLFAETRQSLRIIEQALAALPAGPVRNLSTRDAAGAALGWAEAPLGAAFHWVRLGEDGRVNRYRIIPPSFVNWHAFHLAAEAFAFQDFPIILASFGLSVAENDR